jgi:hypothetical protein
MRLVRSFVVIALLSAFGRALRAQQPAPPPRPPLQSAHAPDSGRIVMDQQLGGDSVQAAPLDLRRGAIYLVEVRPARADVQIRRRVRDGSTAPPLDTVPISRTDSLLHWRQFGVVAREGGAHVAELTNPGVGATQVRVTLLRRAIQDSVPLRDRRTLVFTDNVAPGPSYVTLDSGVVYRIEVRDANIFLAPRSSYRAGVRQHPLVAGSFGSRGVPFVPSFTGEYRIDADGPSASVMIWREELDQVTFACSNSNNMDKPGCRELFPHSSNRTVIAIAIVLPLILVLDRIFR